MGRGRETVKIYTKTGDKGETPEDAEIIAYWDRDAETRYVRDMKARGLEPDVTPEEYLAWWEKKLTETHGK